MRQILALVLCCAAFPIFADPANTEGRSNSFTVHLLTENFAGEGSDPGSYLISPPGRLGANQLVVEVQGLESDRNRVCRDHVGNLFLDGSPPDWREKRKAAGAAPQKKLVYTEAEMRRNGNLSMRPVKLTIEAESRRLWLTISSPEVDRLSPALGRQLFETFLQTPETASYLGCLKLGAVNELILNEVDAAWPRSFDSSLDQRFGILRERNQVDLEPGMRLCLRASESLLRTSPTPIVRQGPSQCVSVFRLYDPDTFSFKAAFDPFFPKFDNFAVGSGAVGLQAVSDGADLAGKTTARRYFRIFYPQAFDRNKDTLSANDVQSVRLVGVDSEDELDRASQCGHAELTNFCRPSAPGSGEDCPCGDLGACPRNPVCFYFHEKALLEPEIQVWVQDQPWWVPVGTTLFDLLEQLGHLEIAAPSRAAGIDDKARARRLLDGSRVRLKRMWKDEPTPVSFVDPGFGALYLPLFKGDRISW